MNSRLIHRSHSEPSRQHGGALWTLTGVVAVIALLAGAAALDDPEPSYEEAAVSERAYSQGVAEGRQQERLVRTEAIRAAWQAGLDEGAARCRLAKGVRP